MAAREISRESSQGGSHGRPSHPDDTVDRQPCGRGQDRQERQRRHAQGENRYTQWYEVQSGDTLWKIAKERYSDGNLYTEIFKANQDVLTDPDKIKVGTEAADSLNPPQVNRAFSYPGQEQEP